MRSSALNLKTKAFIYRFSHIFGLRIYLAQREEDNYIKRHMMRRLIVNIIEGNECDDQAEFGILRGIWHARYGFTSVWTRNKGFFEGLVAKLKHAFDFEHDSW